MRTYNADGTVDISTITGNASDDVKRFVGDPGRFFSHIPKGVIGPIFGQAIQERLEVTEVSVTNKAEEPKKMEGRVVIEIEVADDMLNGGGNMHGGCSAFLIDLCSTLSLFALSLSTTRNLVPSVSQSLNIVYHSPAMPGDKLRLVNTSLAIGARAHSARTEIWSVTHHRLVASGTHIKMAPSAPPPKANL